MANEVLVAIPDTPEIDTCAPRVPSTNSKLTYTGCPSRPNPTGTFASPISSKYRAESRSLAAAPVTAAPGSGGTYTSGSTRVTVTSATSQTSAGSAPCSIRNTSEANRAPSCTASTSRHDARDLISVPPGSGRWVTTTSSSCRYWPGARPTENCSGVAGTVPTTSPTGARPVAMSRLASPACVTPALPCSSAAPAV